MTANREMARRDGWLVRTAGRIGDLGNPFYAEERQRDVWNEASAVGLQLALWLGTIAATAMVWLQGATAVPYAVTLFAILGFSSGMSMLYAHQLGVEVDDGIRIMRLRLVPLGVLLLLFFLGTTRVAPDDGFGAGFARGMLLGGAGVVLWLLWTGLRARRRQSGAAGGQSVP